MKKLTALLFACMMMTCTFTACGDTDDDDDDSKKSTSSSESTTDDEDDTEPTTKKKKPSTTETEEKTSEDDTEDSEFIGKWECIKVVDDGDVYEGEMNGVSIRSVFRIEADSDGTGYIESLGEKLDFEWKKKGKNKIEVLDDDDDTTIFTINGNKMVCSEDGMVLTFEKVKKFSESEKPTKDDPSGKVDSKIVGKWNTKEGGFSGSYVFDENGNGSVYLDATSMYHFEGETLVIGEEEFGPDAYDFDGTNFSLEANGVEFITMEKTEGAKKGLDGTYNITGGYFYDAFEDQYNNTATYSLDMIVDGDELFFRMNDCFTFTADGKTLKFIEGAELMNNQEIKYTITGEKMTFTAGGSKQILTKD